MLKKWVLFLFLPHFFLAAECTVESLEPLLNFLESTADLHRRDPSTPIPIVAIGGCPGVGKSYFSKLLFKHLTDMGIHSAILPLDDFNKSREERLKFTTEWSNDHFHATLLHEVLSKICANERLFEKPVYDPTTGLVGKEILDLESCDLILFEGLYALCSQPPLAYFPYCVYGIYLEASEDDVIKWKWEREQTKLHPRSPERFAVHIDAILADYRNVVAPSKKNALFLIKKDSSHGYKLEALDRSSHSTR